MQSGSLASYYIDAWYVEKPIAMVNCALMHAFGVATDATKLMAVHLTMQDWQRYYRIRGFVSNVSIPVSTL